MKLRDQILSYGLAGALLAGLVGGIGLFASARLSHTLEAAIQAGLSLQTSQEADMMHDAIRGDAQLAVLGALHAQPEQITEAAQDLAEHQKTFVEALRTLAGMPLTPAGRAALARVEPLEEAYVAAAQALVRQAQTDPEGLASRELALQAAFKTLEGEMGALSAAIEQHNQALSQLSKDRVAQSRWLIVSALLLATGVMLGLALWLVRRLTQPMAHAVKVANHLAEGDLTEAVRVFGNDETQQLLRSMAHMQTSFGGIVREVKARAEAVANASVEIAQGNQDLSNRTEQQASSLQQTAATMEQFGSNVRHNADAAEQANALALNASQVAQQGGQLIGRVVGTMSRIHESAAKIGDITGLIDGIAFQTNILALNAAVEAARAGEHGRGFAVVAGEVRSLAKRSAEAAREIKTLISTSVERMEEGNAQVGDTHRTMDEIEASIQRVAALITEISTASRQQSTGVVEVAQTVTLMDQSTQQNAALVEQSAAAAATLRQQAQQMVQAVAVFRLAQQASGNAEQAPLITPFVSKTL